MMDTSVPSSNRKEKASRLTVELYVEGQHDDRRQEAEPHKQDAWRRGEGENYKDIHEDSYLMKLRDGALGCGIIRVVRACLAKTVVGENTKQTAVSPLKATALLLLLQACRKAETNDDFQQQ